MVYKIKYMDIKFKRKVYIKISISLNKGNGEEDYEIIKKKLY